MTEELVKPDEPFLLMERADEEQVIAEIKGAALEHYVYSFEQSGQKVTGLSLVGVRESVRELNRRGQTRIAVSETPPKIEETDDAYTISVYARDELNGGGLWGIKRQPKMMGKRPNPFALEQALSKAQRNALRGLIPEKLVAEMISFFIGQGKVKRVEPLAAPGHKMIPPEGTKVPPEGTHDDSGNQCPKGKELTGLSNRLQKVKAAYVEATSIDPENATKNILAYSNKHFGKGKPSDLTRDEWAQVIDEFASRAAGQAIQAIQETFGATETDELMDAIEETLS